MFGESVFLKPGPRYDAARNPVVDNTAPVELTGCVIEPLGGGELSDLGRDGSSEGFRVFVSGRVPRTPTNTDVLTIRGTDYPVVESPALWVDPEGSALGGTTITAIRRKG